MTYGTAVADTLTQAERAIDEAVDRIDGDLTVLRITRPLTNEQQELMAEAWRSAMPGPSMLLVDPGHEMEISGLRFPLWVTPATSGLEENREVCLLLPNRSVVVGWMTRRFVGGKPTFWTWDPRHGRCSYFVGASLPRILPGVVEPVGWAEIGPDAPQAWATEAPRQQQ